MATITLKGTPFSTSGELPAVGKPAPAASLLTTDLAPLTLADFPGQRVVLNIFPSVDTPTCAASVRRFNAEASSLKNTVVICVSHDLPFALKRFCAAEGLKNVHPASAFRSTFGRDYGVRINDGPLEGLLARAVVVIDAAGKVASTQLVTETSKEPDYAPVLTLLRA